MPASRTRHPGGRPQHQPTQEQLQIAELAAVVGIPHHDIAELLGISTKTLLKHYPSQLKLGKIRATVKVGGSLYNAAIKGNTAAQIFWMKAQAGWREVNRIDLGNADGKPLTHAVVAASVTDEDAMKTYLRMVSGQM